MIRRGWWTVGGGLLLLVVMFGGSSSHSTQAAQRPTLPATWTPTFTPTASPTRTPTQTPTITPTITAGEACAALAVLDPTNGRRYYPYTDTFSLIYGTTVRGVTIQFYALHRLGGEGVLAPASARVGTDTVNVPIAALPRHGLYDWGVQLLDADNNVLCEVNGVFVAGFPVTATPTPDVTATPPPPVTVITTTPVIIVVTATPGPTGPSIREQGATAPPAAVITPDG